MSAPTEQEAQAEIIAEWFIASGHDIRGRRQRCKQAILDLLQAERERTRAEDIEVAKAFGDHYIARSIVAGLRAAALEAAQLPQGKETK